MDITEAWIRAEAERQGLTLSDEDVAAIRRQLETTKAGLARLRLPEAEALEPPYRFCFPCPTIRG